MPKGRYKTELLKLMYDLALKVMDEIDTHIMLKNETDIKYMMSPDRIWNKRYAKDEIKRIKHSQIITDPFPEITTYQISQELKNYIKRFFNLTFKKSPKLTRISIHAAYRMGYEKAYKEILEQIGDMELKT